MLTLIITGTAGFIGSAVCRYLRSYKLAHVIGIDATTYAASRAALDSLKGNPDFCLIEADIDDSAAIMKLLWETQPDGITHLAAETHVDRSIDDLGTFLYTNILGTYTLLETSKHYPCTLPEDARRRFHFHHVSTDEVYGSICATGRFTEDTPYAPNSPYAISKAAADHLARSWHKTYGLPILISNCSNNYGLYQFPEKRISLVIMKALNGEKLPVYGRELNVRDRLFIEDHANALWLIFSRGRIGEKYNVGGAAEWRNIDSVQQLCVLLDDALLETPHRPHKNLIKFVTDHPAHDERYAVDFSKLKNELDWSPRTSLSGGSRKTVARSLANRGWCESIHARKYGGERLGQLRRTGTA